MSEISIGMAAVRTGLKVPTIRYYKQIGLLPAPPRTDGKQRRYGPEALTRLNFIRHARDLGFDIEAVRELLLISTHPDRPCAEVDNIARRHIVDLDRRLAQLVALQVELRRMVGGCGQKRVSECLILETLATPR